MTNMRRAEGQQGGAQNDEFYSFTGIGGVGDSGIGLIGGPIPSMALRDGALLDL